MKNIVLKDLIVKFFRDIKDWVKDFIKFLFKGE